MQGALTKWRLMTQIMKMKMGGAEYESKTLDDIIALIQQSSNHAYKDQIKELQEEVGEYQQNEQRARVDNEKLRFKD